MFFLGVGACKMRRRFLMFHVEHGFFGLFVNDLLNVVKVVAFTFFVFIFVLSKDKSDSFTLFTNL